MAARTFPSASGDGSFRQLLALLALCCLGIASCASAAVSTSFKSKIQELREQAKGEGIITQKLLLAAISDQEIAELKIPSRALLSAGPSHGGDSKRRLTTLVNAEVDLSKGKGRGAFTSGEGIDRKVETLDEVDDFDLTRLRRIPRRAMQVTSIYGGEGRRQLSGVYGGEGQRSLVGVYGGEGRR